MKDPAQYIREVCVGLSRADTHTGALEWFDIPITELTEWYKAVESLEKQSKRKK